MTERFNYLIGKTPKRDPEVYNTRPELHGVIHESHFDLVTRINEVTVGKFAEEWSENVGRNKKLWRRHPKIGDLRGLAKNKCVIGIGAGPSFQINKNVLKDIVDHDGVKMWQDRDFVTIASNHQYKPLLEMGIIPDFVLLVDAGNDAVYDQLCRDIPFAGQNTTLITGIQVMPKIAKHWTKQGREIVFYSTRSKDIQEAFDKHIGKQERHKVELGGNVLNGAWMLGVGIFNSTVFMCVGNDLSFVPKDTVKEQREAYYADGDYTTNAEETGSGRDEAKSKKRWGGFKLERRHVFLPNEPIGSLKRYNIELDIVGTSHTLWVYKTWLESTLMSQTVQKVHFHYFNCSESGILGVMARKLDGSSMARADNWYLLDEVAINQHTKRHMYHTAMLKDAANMFIETKRSQIWEPAPDAQYAIGSAQMH